MALASQNGLQAKDQEKRLELEFRHQARVLELHMLGNQARETARLQIESESEVD